MYNRDGKELGELPKGDMYIRDLKNTKGGRSSKLPAHCLIVEVLAIKLVPSPLLPAGHVTNCTGGCWHPTDKTAALTCSEDGTLRVWDVTEVQQKTVIKPQVCAQTAEAPAVHTAADTWLRPPLSY